MFRQTLRVDPDSGQTAGRALSLHEQLALTLSADVFSADPARVDRQHPYRPQESGIYIEHMGNSVLEDGAQGESYRI